MGEAFLIGNLFLFLEIGLPSLGIFIVAGYVLRRVYSDK